MPIKYFSTKVNGGYNNNINIYGGKYIYIKVEIIKSKRIDFCLFFEMTKLHFLTKIKNKFHVRVWAKLLKLLKR